MAAAAAACAVEAERGERWRRGWGVQFFFFIYFCAELSAVESRRDGRFEGRLLRVGQRTPEWDGKKSHGRRGKENDGNKQGNSEVDSRTSIAVLVFIDRLVDWRAIPRARVVARSGTIRCKQ